MSGKGAFFSTFGADPSQDGRDYERFAELRIASHTSMVIYGTRRGLRGFRESNEAKPSGERENVIFIEAAGQQEQ